MNSVGGRGLYINLDQDNGKWAVVDTAINLRVPNMS
jgi:hypothetical protein